ncbi:MAG: VTT domain-containing protein, partial [Leptospira sp.]|nr:VTT domain-containing protein [Leptospira sp.]
MSNLFILISLFFSTFVLEDPTVFTGLTLVREGKISLAEGLFSLAGGILVGDVLNYILGRYAERIPFVGNKIEKLTKKAEQIEWIRIAEGWFSRLQIYAIIAARFTPGTRFIIYYLCGKNRMNFLLFSTLSAFLAVLWVYLVYNGINLSLDFFVKFLKVSNFLALFLSFAGFLLAIQIVKTTLRPSGWKLFYSRLVSYRYWEFWPSYIFYFPIVFFYIWICIRRRVPPTAISVVNPCFPFGGMSFDSKFEMLGVFSDHKSNFARQIRISDRRKVSEMEILNTIRKNKFVFPFVVKPDKGHRGNAFRIIRTESDMMQYMNLFPEAFLVQEYIDYPLEYGVFWLKIPGEKGRIFSVTRKILSSVAGDGNTSLEDLIWNDPRAKYLAGVYRKRNFSQLKKIIPEGKKYFLGNAGNHCQGAIFEDGAGDISGKTLQKITEICESVKGFDFGRFDIKFKDKLSLKNGRNFKILEV